MKQPASGGRAATLSQGDSRPEHQMGTRTCSLELNVESSQLHVKTLLHSDGALGKYCHLHDHHGLQLKLFLLQRSSQLTIASTSPTLGSGPERTIPKWTPVGGGGWLALCHLKAQPQPQGVSILDVNIWEENHILPWAFYKVGAIRWAHCCHKTS